MYNPNRAQGETYPIENRSQVETLTRTYIFNTQKRLFLICPVDNLGRGQTSGHPLFSEGGRGKHPSSRGRAWPKSGTGALFLEFAGAGVHHGLFLTVGGFGAPGGWFASAFPLPLLRPWLGKWLLLLVWFL